MSVPKNVPGYAKQSNYCTLNLAWGEVDRCDSSRLSLLSRLLLEALRPRLCNKGEFCWNHDT